MRRIVSHRSDRHDEEFRVAIASQPVEKAMGGMGDPTTASTAEFRLAKRRLVEYEIRWLRPTALQTRANEVKNAEAMTRVLQIGSDRLVLCAFKGGMNS
jgi:hypothetical protein